MKSTAVIANIDWVFLRQQKSWLEKHRTPEAESLLSLLDHIQDSAAAQGHSFMDVYGQTIEEVIKT